MSNLQPNQRQSTFIQLGCHTGCLGDTDCHAPMAPRQYLPALRTISFHTPGRDEAMGDGSVREGLGTRYSGSIKVWKSEEF
jgi:hypothetical protein